MSRLLIDEPPIAITPSLIRTLGGHDLAAFAQQVWYVAQGPDGIEHDGHQWARCSIERWCELVVLSEGQAKRIVAALTDLGVLVRCQLPGYDRTAASRIDVEALEQLRTESSDPSGRNRPGGTALNQPDRTGRNRPDPPIAEKGRALQESDAASTPSSADPTLAKGCPVATCKAAAGSRCLPGGNASRDTKGRHVKRVAGAVVDRWWDCVKERTGHSPSAPGWEAMRAMVETALRAGHDPNAVYRVVCSLHAEGQIISGQVIDRRLTAREPRRGGRPAVEQQLDALQYDAQGNLVAQ